MAAVMKRLAEILVVGGRGIWEKRGASCGVSSSGGVAEESSRNSLMSGPSSSSSSSSSSSDRTLDSSEGADVDCFSGGAVGRGALGTVSARLDQVKTSWSLVRTVMYR